MEDEIDENMKASANSLESPSSSLSPNPRNNVVVDLPLMIILPRFHSSLPLMICSGTFLGIHFSAWVYSIETTSLAHSLTWVSMGPIIISWGQWILYICGITCCSIFGTVNRPSTWAETSGAIVGLLGALMMLRDVTKFAPSSTAQASLQHEPTLKGDLAAFLGAFAVSIYLVIGRSCRSWMPLWLYIFPVVVTSAISSMMFALLDSEQPAKWSGLSETSVFGFLNMCYFPYALYLGVGPGIAGHTVFNALLKYMSPLIISTAMLSEPLFGSVLGYIFGMQQIPGLWTFLGGFVLLISLFFVSYSKEEVDEKASDSCKLLKANEKEDKYTCVKTDSTPLKNETNHQYGAV